MSWTFRELQDYARTKGYEMQLSGQKILLVEGEDVFIFPANALEAVYDFLETGELPQNRNPLRPA